MEIKLGQDLILSRQQGMTEIELAWLLKDLGMEKVTLRQQNSL